MTRRPRAPAPELGFPLEGERVRLELGERERERSGAGHAATGRIVRLPATEAGWFGLRQRGSLLVIESLCVAEPQRSFGLGSEAAALLREAASRAGFARIRAFAPPDRGLAVYFWMRMGFQPLHGHGTGDGLWFQRLLAAPENV